MKNLTQSCQRFLYLFAFLFCQIQLNAQVDTVNFNADELFKIARNEAFNGKRELARSYLFAILAKKPNYQEVRVFIGRTYAWDDKYTEAKAVLNEAITLNPKEIDAYVVLCDIALWSDQYADALALSDRGLKYARNDEVLLYKKAKALIGLDKNEEAAAVLSNLLLINPSNADAKSLAESIRIAARKNGLSLNYNNDIFERTFSDAHYAFLQYNRSTKLGSLIGRYNTSKRFGTTGNQFEVDFYPSLAKGLYAYLNYGVSQSSIYPKHRVGGELYFKLPKSFEGSGGFRYLFFSGNSSVTLYTLTLGKYVGNYWFSLRTFLTPDQAGLSNSYIFLARRYFADAENYLGLTAGYGFSPDQSRQSLSDNSQISIVSLRSKRIGLEYQRSFLKRCMINISYTYGSQQFLFDASNFIGFHSLSSTFKLKF